MYFITISSLNTYFSILFYTFLYYFLFTFIQAFIKLIDSTKTVNGNSTISAQ